MSALAFELPATLEATAPPLARDAVKLMVARRGKGTIAHARFDDLPELLGRRASTNLGAWSRCEAPTAAGPGTPGAASASSCPAGRRLSLSRRTSPAAG
jgi:hypothetical protein